ncbi:MAG: FtsX-like permease family protein [Myxococcales bacterium FL481]|nr:MAG: FtsX-like permease family protein [Myxococcales bacterium FL481]
MTPSQRVRWRLLMVGRELAAQAGRHAFHALCLAIGLAAYAGTLEFSGRVTRAVDTQTRSFLGTDLELSSTTRLTADHVQALRDQPEVGRLLQVEHTVTMARTVDAAQSRLVEVEAMGPDYASWTLEQGRVRPRPAETWATLGRAELVAEASLAAAWKLEPGDAVVLAGHELTMVATFDPAEVELTVGGNPMRLGPKVYVQLDTAEQLGLTGRGTRFQSRLLMDAAEGTPTAQARASVAAYLAAHHLTGPRLRTFRETATTLSTPLRNLGFFLEQISFGVLALALLGAATSLIAYLRSQSAAAYVLRCLGATPTDLMMIFGGVVGAVCLAGTVVGVGVGQAVAGVLATALSQFQPIPLVDAGPAWPIWIGGLAALIVVGLICVPSLAELSRRQGTELDQRARVTSRRRQLASWGVAVIVVVGLVLWRAPSLGLAAYVLGGFAAALGLLWGGATLFLGGLARRMDGMSPAWKIGVAQLLAQRGLTALLMATIGCAVFLLVSVLFVRNDLVAPLRTELPQNRPTTYLLGIADHERAPLEALLIEQTGREPDVAPMIQARLIAIDGVAIQSSPAVAERDDQDLARANRERSRSRFHRLTYRQNLQPNERIVAGEFWPPDPTGAAATDVMQASMEARFAERMGVGLGNRLSFDIQGVPVEVTITSLREVDWIAGRPNFFTILHPGSVLGAPARHVMAINAGDAPARQALQAAVVERFPSVTVIDAHAVIERMSSMMDGIVQVTTLMAALVLAASLTVLGASILATRVRKTRDFAVLRTLGAQRRLLVRAWFAEFFILGATASAAAAVVAVFGGRLLVQQVFELPTTTPVLMPVLVTAAAILACIAVGTLGSAPVLARRPSDQLRDA